MTAPAYSTIPALLAGAPDAARPAIRATDGRGPLTHTGLRRLAERTVGALNGIGVGRGDRVAIVLPNGPEMAAAFVAIACGATTAPLNPAYKAEEFEFYLADLRAKALVIRKGMESPAREVAARLGVPVLDLAAEAAAGAGAFALEGGGAPGGGAAANPGLAGAEDVALVLHTSGTTARPKIVPLTHGNVCAAAAAIARTLELTPRDACLNVMPLFHIHGLIAATLASLHAGSAVVCTSGFNALRFFGWLDAERPTWYTAVPTMHQAILARAERNREVIARAPLRFLRSSSASLPAQAMKDLAAAFGAPVIEAYGMTEASHQMCSNPLPPRPQKPGLVGLPAGPEVAIMDEDGTILPRGAVGEVVIRGPSVTRGYEANPEANARAFTKGWFRTGDQGMFDGDGYLMLTGRLKELIKRGGEQVSPLEVDGVLSGHPAVAQALTFSIPHPMLGEEVGAAVVLREGTECTERELRDYAAKHLADFKVPRTIVFLPEIPKGATGKLQRIGLAEKLGITA
jgi:acyl-CoA synthetase (AMP-forming)/AMP-acid ligase II